MPNEFGVFVVVEDWRDYQTAKGFVNRALAHASSGFDAKAVVWRGAGTGQEFVRWQDLDALVLAQRLPRVRGHFRGLPAKMYAVSARKALRLAEHLGQSRAVVLVVDGDNKPQERLQGLNQAREEHQSLFRDACVVVGVPTPCREAWVLCGANVTKDKLENLGLNFHPCQEPQRLNTVRGDARSAKKVAEHLVGQTLEEEQACWQSTPFDKFVAHGDACGLKAFLSEVQERLAPVLGL